MTPQKIIPIVGESPRVRQAMVQGIQMTVRDTVPMRVLADHFRDMGAHGFAFAFVHRRLEARNETGGHYYTPEQRQAFTIAYHEGRVERAENLGLRDEAVVYAAMLKLARGLS